MLFFVYIKIFHHTSYSVYEGEKKKKISKTFSHEKIVLGKVISAMA